MFEDRFVIVLMRKEDKINRVVKSVVFKRLPPMPLKIGNKAYTIDYKMPSYVSKNKRFYLVNLESGTQFTMEPNPPLLNPTDLDLLIANHVIADICSGIMDEKKDKILFFILGAAIGGMIGYIVCQSLMQTKIDEMSNAVINFPTTTTTALKLLWQSAKFL